MTNPSLLDAVEDLIGPESSSTTRRPGSRRRTRRAFVSWHQDSTYFGLEPLEQVTAWVALSPATRRAGCVRVLPGSHKLGQLPADLKPDRNNLLTSGQTVKLDVDEPTVEMPLQPGEVSLHHACTIHGSAATTATTAASASASHYVPAHVRPNAASGQVGRAVLGDAGAWQGAARSCSRRSAAPSATTIAAAVAAARCRRRKLPRHGRRARPYDGRRGSIETVQWRRHRRDASILLREERASTIATSGRPCRVAALAVARRPRSPSRLLRRQDSHDRRQLRAGRRLRSLLAAAVAPSRQSHPGQARPSSCRTCRARRHRWRPTTSTPPPPRTAP